MMATIPILMMMIILSLKVSEELRRSARSLSHQQTSPGCRSLCPGEVHLVHILNGKKRKMAIVHRTSVRSLSTGALMTCTWLGHFSPSLSPSSWSLASSSSSHDCLSDKGQCQQMVLHLKMQRVGCWADPAIGGSTLQLVQLQMESNYKALPLPGYLPNWKHKLESVIILSEL